MPRIPDEWVDRIKREVFVSDLAIRAGVELRRVGRELIGRCPFPPHEDSTPSLSINEERNVFQCFGCGVAGTSIDWVKRDRGLDFRESVEWMLWEFFPDAARELLGESRADAGAARRLSRRSRAPELPCPFDFEGDDRQLLLEYVDHCHALFLESAEAQDYLKKRGLDSPELVSRFKLGYQDRTLGLRLPEKATKGGAEKRARFQKLGLIRESGHAQFVGSLLVPTIDLSGNVTTIYGRKTRDDLNKDHASPKHLYLAGPDQDVFNEEAFVEHRQIVLTEARLDALSFWCHGFRNVTACRGAGNFSKALLDAFVRHGIERCYIAFDRDESGDAGALKAAENLTAAGVECFRVHFPKGMDANEVALKMQPAAKTLALFLRSAEWMGNGRGPRNGTALHAPATHVYEAPSSVAETELVSSEPAAEATSGPSEATEEVRSAELDRPAERAAEEGSSRVDTGTPATSSTPTTSGALEASTPPAPPAPPPITGLVSSTEDEALFAFGDRHYRVRGLSKCLSYGSLSVILKAERQGDYFAPPSPISGWFLDKLDLIASRQRDHFEKRAAHELGVKDEIVRHDLGLVVGGLERLQEERIKKALEPKTKVPEMTDADRDEALDFWRKPGLLGRILEHFGALGLVGEETNKLVCAIAAVSRLLERPLAIIIQSSSAAGKTSLMEALLALLPDECYEKYTAVSGKSLFYFDEETSLRHKVLAIVEEEGAEKATYPLKLLQSEGELRMASTGKDPHTGRLVTHLYKVEGPVVIILTTTSIELDPELENRCLRLTVDEGREQTRLIHELQRKRQTLEGLVAQKRKSKLRALHKNAHRLLRPLKVINPYEPYLTFSFEQTRARRDHDKYLTIIEALALMHQHQRPIVTVDVDGEKTDCVEVQLEDVEVAGRIAGEILGRTLDELPPQTRVFLDSLHEKVAEISERESVSPTDLHLSRKQIREMTGWGDTQVKVHLGRLVDLEYVLWHRASRGNGTVYELLYRGEGKRGERFVLGLVDVEKLRLLNLPPTDTALSSPNPATNSAPTTADRSGFPGDRSGVGRPLVGPRSGVGRHLEEALRPALQAAFGDSGDAEAENSRFGRGEAAGRSYTPRGPVRLLRLNLLRRPAVALRRLQQPGAAA